MSDSPAAILYDANGNPVSVVLDGGVYKLEMLSKINAPLPAGTNNIGDVDVVSSALPTGAATEATLATRATEATLASRATEATLAAADAKLATIDAVLDSIKDVDGIKKITDPLPAGTNNIGDVDVVSSALPTGAATEATLATRATAAAQTDGSQKTQVVDGTGDTLAIDASGRAAIQNQPNMDVALSTRATEATLAAADAKLATIDAVLDSIKDVDGIKKITDPLPTGSNVIGRVEGKDADGVAPTGDPLLIGGFDGTNVQTVRTNTAGRAQEVLYDDAGNAVGVVLDNSIYRLETRSSIVGQDGGVGAEKKVSVIDDATAPADKRLLVEADFKPGATISIGNPPLVTAVDVHLTDDGTATGSRDMIVNGSGTPQVFYFPADPVEDIFFNVLRIVMTASTVTFNGASWMKGPALANGILLEAIVNNGTLINLGNLQYNEDLMHLPGSPVVNFGGGGGIVIATLPFSGREKLAAGSGDLVRITIRDNFTAGGAYGGTWLQATFYGFKEA